MVENRSLVRRMNQIDSRKSMIFMPAIVQSNSTHIKN